MKVEQQYGPKVLDGWKVADAIRLLLRLGYGTAALRTSEPIPAGKREQSPEEAGFFGFCDCCGHTHAFCQCCD